MTHLGLLSCGKAETKPAEMDVRSLTPKEYNLFVKESTKEHLKDAQVSGRQAEKMMIVMLGLEKKPEFHGIFEIDVNFNINAMFILVANANKIKREEAFLKAFKDQIKTTRHQLKSEAERTFFDALTGLLLQEQAKL